MSEVAGGAYRLEAMAADDISRASEIIDRYRDLQLGLADSSLVVLAERYGIHDVLTLDERHFRAVDGPGGRPFRILPADA
jgi:predicted nucleic acid-binding protein